MSVWGRAFFGTPRNGIRRSRAFSSGPASIGGTGREGRQRGQAGSWVGSMALPPCMSERRLCVCVCVFVCLHIYVCVCVCVAGHNAVPLVRHKKLSWVQLPTLFSHLFAFVLLCFVLFFGHCFPLFLLSHSLSLSLSSCKCVEYFRVMKNNIRKVFAAWKILEKTQENLSHLFAVGKCNFDVSPTAFQRGNSLDGRTATQTSSLHLPSRPHSQQKCPQWKRKAVGQGRAVLSSAAQRGTAQEEKRTQLRATISHHKTASSWKKRVVAQGSRLLTHHNVWWEGVRGRGRGPRSNPHANAHTHRHTDRLSLPANQGKSG